MKYNEPYIKSKAHGTTTKTITKEEVRSLEFYIHEDINEQNKIAEVLNSFDKLIFTNKQLQTNITKLTLGIYNYWFNQFNFPDKEGKRTKFERILSIACRIYKKYLKFAAKYKHII